MPVETAYLNSVRKQFLAYKKLGDSAIAQLNGAELEYQPNPSSNSIATIIRHLNGNMKSRFTNFLTEDGEKPWRNRDKEFLSPAGYYPAGEIVNLWEEGWTCVIDAIDKMAPEQLLETVTIRHEPHLAIDAINRQLAHYSSHVGQIVYLAKMIKGKDWVTLSIPVGESAQFNIDMSKIFNLV